MLLEARASAPRDDPHRASGLTESRLQNLHS
jgi:hypothetical protein